MWCAPHGFLGQSALSPAAALAAGYDLVFLMAAGLGLAIALVSLLLPRDRRG